MVEVEVRLPTELELVSAMRLSQGISTYLGAVDVERLEALLLGEDGALDARLGDVAAESAGVDGVEPGAEFVLQEVLAVDMLLAVPAENAGVDANDSGIELLLREVPAADVFRVTVLRAVDALRTVDAPLVNLREVSVDVLEGLRAVLTDGARNRVRERRSGLSMTIF